MTVGKFTLLDGERMKQALGARYQTTPLAEALSVSLQKRAK